MKMKVSNHVINYTASCYIADIDQPTAEAVEDNVICPSHSTYSVEECSRFVLVTNNVDKNIQPSY